MVESTNTVKNMYTLVIELGLCFGISVRVTGYRGTRMAFRFTYGLAIYLFPSPSSSLYRRSRQSAQWMMVAGRTQNIILQFPYPFLSHPVPHTITTTAVSSSCCHPLYRHQKPPTQPIRLALYFRRPPSIHPEPQPPNSTRRPSNSPFPSALHELAGSLQLVFECWAQD